jgi:glycosyltransferase involved in cell wall biosynthesis
MNAPLVSVVIAAWNSGAYLAQTLTSALEQTWHNLEVILVDDGSTDDTRVVVTPFLPHIHYERQEHLGLAAARNYGIQLARGEYIALLDADDLWYPEKIKIQMAIAERNLPSGLIACDAEEFSDGAVLQQGLLPANVFERASAAGVQPRSCSEVTSDFHREFIARNLIYCPAQVLFPHHVVDEIGPFIDAGAQDYDYYLRVARAYPITFHRDVLVRWRYRSDSLSGPRAERAIRYGFWDVSILLSHSERCRRNEARWVKCQIKRRIHSLAQNLLVWGREHHRVRATYLFLKLIWANPWTPLPSVYFFALWSPSRVTCFVGSCYRRLHLWLHGSRIGHERL